MTASERLTLALIRIAAHGERTHCSDVGTGGLWLSEMEAERAEACKLCVGCPVIFECRQAAEANHETWGVWGAKDFSRRPGTKKKAAA